MSEAIDRWRQIQCEGKEGYSSFTLAKRIAKRRNTRRNVALTAYRCKFCAHFHIGTRTRQAKRPPRFAEAAE